MGNCKDCKHWRNALGHMTWNTCEHPDTVEHDARIAEDDFALHVDVHDDSGLTCGLKTGPMFGCLKFVSKVDASDGDATPATTCTISTERLQRWALSLSQGDTRVRSDIEAALAEQGCSTRALAA